MTTPTKTQTTTNVDHSYITKLPTFADRGEAIAKRLEDVKANPKYQALPEDKRAKVRADLYDKYVPNSYSGFHLPVPDKNTWVGATASDTTLRATKGTSGVKLSDSYKGTKTEQFGQDALVGAAKAFDGIQLFGARVANKVYSKMFGLDQHMSHPDDSMLHKALDAADINIKKHLNNFIDTQHARLQSEDFWFQTHPRDTTIGQLGSTTGELIATLPLYEAIGMAGVGGKVGALTAKLANNPIGQFVAKRLTTATDFFLASLVESGGDPKQAAGAGVQAGLYDTGMALVGKGIKVAAAPLIKKWTANTIAMGGKPFAQDIAQSAMHEIHTEAEAVAKEGEEGATLKRIKAFYEDRKKYDPLMSQLHAGEKISLGSIAQTMYDKPLRNLSKDQRDWVFMKRVELIHQAAQEAPVHLPDLQAKEVEHNIQKERQGNPVLNQVMQALEKQGVKFSEAVIENDVTQVAKETGISNTKGATKKLDKAAKPYRSVGADLGTGEEKIYDFAKYNGDTISYMRAPRNRVRVANTVSDRSEAGLNKFIDLLKESTPARIRFEDPAHLMLFHYGNSEQLPAGMKETIQRRIKQTKGYEFATPAQLKQEADMMHSHLLTLAKSGRLVNEGNIFRSTKTTGPYSWTKWQTQLSDEVINDAIKPAQMALKNHPTALKSFNSTIAQLKKTRPKLTTAAEVKDFESSISSASSNIVQHLSDTKLGGRIE